MRLLCISDISLRKYIQGNMINEFIVIWFRMIWRLRIFQHNKRCRIYLAARAMLVCDLEREGRNYTNISKIFILSLPNRRRLLIWEKKREISRYRYNLNKNINEKKKTNDDNYSHSRIIDFYSPLRLKSRGIYIYIKAPYIKWSMRLVHALIATFFILFDIPSGNGLYDKINSVVRKIQFQSSLYY